MTNHATGTFDLTLTPQADSPADADKAQHPIPARMAIEKHFHGALEATSHGQMLSAMTDVKGSAGYVAIEKVTGSLEGRSGSFVLQHTGTMNRGVPQLSATVIPDSGTGQLVGLAGKMTINIVDKKHIYDFEYTLAESAEPAAVVQ